MSFASLTYLVFLPVVALVSRLLPQKVRPVWLLEGAAFVNALDITDEEKELILHKNAERLYHL